jgi:hypothetical protein
MRPRNISYMIGTAARALPFGSESETLGITEVLSAPCSPWQNPYVERLIGSTRRECLAHIMVLSEWHLKRILSRYFDDDHRWRTHLSLDMDCPEARPVQPPALGPVHAVPEVWGLHHHDEWRSLSSIQSLPLGLVSGDASSLFVSILLLAYGRIVRISATR